MRVLVTGASGFLGHAACSELASRGHEVLALVRRPGSEPPGTTAVSGDLEDGAALDTALASAGPRCVIHLAAEIASQRNASRIQAGTWTARACCSRPPSKAGVERIVFASTVVTGEADGGVLSEDEPLPVGTAYGASKREGERLVGESQLQGVVIRPGHIYGPGGWYAEEIVRRVKQPGRFAVVGRGDNWWDVVHVADVAKALGWPRPSAVGTAPSTTWPTTCRSHCSTS